MVQMFRQTPESLSGPSYLPWWTFALAEPYFTSAELLTHPKSFSAQSIPRAYSCIGSSSISNIACSVSFMASQAPFRPAPGFGLLLLCNFSPRDLGRGIGRPP